MEAIARPLNRGDRDQAPRKIYVRSTASPRRLRWILDIAAQHLSMCECKGLGDILGSCIVSSIAHRRLR
jgi:hypothetical protein